MSERNKSALGKRKSGVKNPQDNPSKAQGGRPASSSQSPAKYINRLRWDDKAKMFTVVDIPQKRIRKD